MVLARCTPPWYRFSVIDAEGQLLTDGRCAVDVRGDVTHRAVLPATAMHIDNRIVVACGGAAAVGAETARDMSTLQFVLPARASTGGTAVGVYRVSDDSDRSGSSDAEEDVYFTATLYPTPADVARWRNYRAVSGQLAITNVSPAPDGTVRVTGTFHVRARRYWKFD